MHMRGELKTKKDLNNKVTELQNQVDELKDLVNTLLSVICEEPDGVHSGSAPGAPQQGTTQYAM
jgi:hypothetical protein